MKICFYAHSSIPVHARSLEERPLGGTETGLIRVAESLRRRGHEVYVVTAYPNPLPYNYSDGPVFIPAGALSKIGVVDILVAVQYWRALFLGIPAKKHLFWTGDGYEQFSNWGIGDRRVIEKIDQLCAVSTWHAETLRRTANFPKDKISIVGNGIHPPFFQGSEPRNPLRLIYTSAPYRGLDLAAQYFTILKGEFPDLEFHIFSGLSIYDRESEYQGPHADRFRVLRDALRKIPGIVLHGNVTQRELAREYMKSAILFYPNTVEETCCITALEAQAAGCPVIASAISALPETVGNGGIVIGGEIGSQRYNEEILQSVRALLTRNELWKKLSEHGRERIFQNYTWDHVALRIEQSILSANGPS